MRRAIGYVLASILSFIIGIIFGAKIKPKKPKKTYADIDRTYYEI